MKIITLLISIMSFATLQVNAQNKAHADHPLITLDFKTKNISFPYEYQKIKKGDYIRIKVTNYNPYLYRVVIEDIDSSIVQPTDGSFLSFFLNPDKLSSIVGGLSGLVDPPPAIVDANKNLSLFNKMVPDYKEKKKILLHACGLTQPILATTKDTSKWIMSILTCYYEIITKRKDTIVSLKNKIEEELYNYARKYSIQRKLYPDFKLIEDFGKNDFTTIENFMKQARAEVAKQISETDNEYKKYQISLSPFDSFIIKTSELRIPDVIIDSFYKTAIRELNETAQAVDYKHTIEIISNFEKITQNSSEYISLPLYLYDDFKKINISIQPVEANSILPSYKTSFSVPEKLKNIWGISSGIFVTGLYNHTYSNKRKANDTTYNLIEDGQGKAQIGVNALAYFGRRMGNTNSFLAACFGAGMSIEKNPKPRILLGASYITGERSRILVSIGYAGGYVSTLSDAYDTKTDYKTPATNYQKDRIKGSVFLSLNYSFLSK